MSRKRIIIKIAFLAAWLVVIMGITVLLIAANDKHDEKICRDVMVHINGSGDKYYVQAEDILRKLEKAAKGKLVKKPINTISASSLEKMIEKDRWIRDAEVYFDREDVLHVKVNEREPIARVFDINGGSFYIDSSGHRMPLLDDISARVPVFTGFTAARKLNRKDSSLLMEIKSLANYLYRNSFWNAQAGQIDLSDDGKFEIIPVIGDHVIKLGRAENIEEKLDRAFVFYKKVLSKTGFNKYAVIDVQFDNQVIGVHRGTVSAVDSIQLQKNIEELLEKSNIQNLTAEMLPDAMAFKTDSVKAVVNTNPIPTERPKPAVTQITSAKDPAPEKTRPANNSKKSPKAVMPRRG